MGRKLITAGLGLALFIYGAYLMFRQPDVGHAIPLLIGASLTFLAFHEGRVALVVFGHVCIVIGCMLVAWGVYLLPHSEPTLEQVFTRPLFWGLISIFGGICANYHGFCNCVRRS